MTKKSNRIKIKSDKHLERMLRYAKATRERFLKELTNEALIPK